MPELDGIEATRQIKKALPQIEVLIFTMHNAEELMLSAFDAGARAFVVKSINELELIEAIKVLSRHEPFVGSTASEAVRNSVLKLPRTSVL